MDSASPIRTSSRQPAVGDARTTRDATTTRGRDDYQGTRRDVQGHGLGEPDKNVKSEPAVGDGEDYQGNGDDYQGRRRLPGHGDDYQGRGEDVQGHSFVNPAPPADFSKGGPSSGGEFVRNHEDADPSD